jgi:P2 family phage contractile tail tube protein
MGLPRKLKNFALFADGENYMGEVPEVTLPTLTRQMDEYRGGGMNMPIQHDFGMEGMEAEIKAAGWFEGLLATWGSPRVDAAMLRFAGALQADDTGQITACEVVLRGRFAEWDPGSSKAGDPTEQTYKMAVAYYKLTLDGQVVLEIDAVNMIENVNGEDRMQQVRAALGV